MTVFEGNKIIVTLLGGSEVEVIIECDINKVKLMIIDKINVI